MVAGALSAPLATRRAIAAAGAPRKLVLIAGKASHGPGLHEFRAGNILLEKRMRGVPGLRVELHEQGWVRDEATLADADAVVIFCDGGKNHPAIQDGRIALLEKLVQRGAGIGMMHFGVEVPAEKGGTEFRRWIGGHYEHQFSCNPIWDAAFERFPDHPIARGVQPFTIHDEWYFNMRFAEGFDATGPKTIKGVKFTPVLVAKPSDATRDGPYVYPKGPYPHIQEAKGRPEAKLWAVERPDGGRGFGFTGAHFHKNWQQDDFRKTILNALCWVSNVEVPAGGITSAAVSDDELMQNLDPKK
ncbi:MAG: ThuA domain-containing protein [Verrucomicrobia bacterium]|nr:ThuA domain-containing protein [Verrucomicrobiota bacterium]